MISKIFYSIIKKIKYLVSRHKLLSAICLLALIVIIMMMYVFFNLFVGGSNKYGDRLKGIESHKVEKKEQEEVVSFLKEKNEVNDASIRIQGKIIYIHIEYTRETSLDTAKAIATESLAKISDDEKKFYDIGYYLTQTSDDNSEDKGFIVTGNKSNELDSISWIKS